MLANRSYSFCDVVKEIVLASPSDWVRLTSFIWKPGSEHDLNLQLERAINVLRNLHPPKLQEVTVVIGFHSFRSLFLHDLLARSALGLCAELENTLITFPQPTISFSTGPKPINSHRHHSSRWVPMLERFFPRLAGRCALGIDTEYCESYYRLFHR